MSKFGEIILFAIAYFWLIYLYHVEIIKSFQDPDLVFRYSDLKNNTSYCVKIWKLNLWMYSLNPHDFAGEEKNYKSLLKF